MPRQVQWCLFMWFLRLAAISEASNTTSGTSRLTPTLSLYFTASEGTRTAWEARAAIGVRSRQQAPVGERSQQQALVHTAQHHIPGRRLHGKVTSFKVLLGVGFLVVPSVVSFVIRYLRPSRTTFSERAPLVDLGPRWMIARATFFLIAWMGVSIGFVLFNKWMFTAGGFPYPVVLTAMHMGSCWLVFSVIACLPHELRKNFMPDADAQIPWDIWVKGLVPAAILLAGSLGIGNLGFLYASVAFIQMVKPVNVVVTSIAGFLWGLEVATPSHILIACVVCGGVALAACADVQFSLAGLICQLTASTCEGVRLIILQGIMQGRLKLDPITTLQRFTPVAGASLCIISCFIDGTVQWSRITNVGILVLNCLIAVLLNVLIAYVLRETSAVVFVLAGVTKDIFTIAFSVVIWKTHVSSLEVTGYCISMLGILMYKVYKDNLDKFKEKGFLGGFGHALGSIGTVGK